MPLNYSDRSRQKKKLKAQDLMAVKVDAHGKKYLEIMLTQNRVAVADLKDFEILSSFKWSAVKIRNTFYACRGFRRCDSGKRTISMHRMLLGLTDKSIFVDHKDGNGLNNQRNNLRICTPAQNQQNRNKSKNNKSGFNGVSFDKRTNSWAVAIQLNYKKIFLGRFKIKQDAVKAYSEAAIKYFGEFARTNFK